jgi:class 3 adenylate cyclase
VSLEARPDDSFEVSHGVRPQLRIGLNTGPAIVGNVQNSADAGVNVLSDTVNVAARFQALAPGDRAVLQAAAVVGRHFNPDLLTR